MPIKLNTMPKLGANGLPVPKKEGGYSFYKKPQSDERPDEGPDEGPDGPDGPDDGFGPDGPDAPDAPDDDMAMGM